MTGGVPTTVEAMKAVLEQEWSWLWSGFQTWTWSWRVDLQEPRTLWCEIRWSKDLAPPPCSFMSFWPVTKEHLFYERPLIHHPSRPQRTYLRSFFHVVETDAVSYFETAPEKSRDSSFLLTVRTPTEVHKTWGPTAQQLLGTLWSSTPLSAVSSRWVCVTSQYPWKSLPPFTAEQVFCLFPPYAQKHGLSQNHFYQTVLAYMSPRMAPVQKTPGQEILYAFKRTRREFTRVLFERLILTHTPEASVEQTTTVSVADEKEEPADDASEEEQDAPYVTDRDALGDKPDTVDGDPKQGHKKTSRYWWEKAPLLPFFQQPQPQNAQ